MTEPRNMKNEPESGSTAEEEYGKRVRILRNRSGYSIRRLADLSGVTASVISGIERGKISPSITTLRKILEALGTNLATFFSSRPKEQESISKAVTLFPLKRSSIVQGPPPGPTSKTKLSSAKNLVQRHLFLATKPRWRLER